MMAKTNKPYTPERYTIKLIEFLPHLDIAAKGYESALRIESKEIQEEMQDYQVRLVSTTLYDITNYKLFQTKYISEQMLRLKIARKVGDRLSATKDHVNGRDNIARKLIKLILAGKLNPLNVYEVHKYLVKEAFTVEVTKNENLNILKPIQEAHPDWTWNKKYEEGRIVLYEPRLYVEEDTPISEKYKKVYYGNYELHPKILACLDEKIIKLLKKVVK